MVNNLTLSPAGLALLDMLEQQTGVSFEVVHLWLDPVRQSPRADFSLREEPAVADEVSKALRTGEVRLGAIHGVAFGVFPLRREREVLGCLIASTRHLDEPLAGGHGLEEAGALGRGILESDLLVNRQLAGAEAVTRRLHATLRFLGQLGTYDTDREVMHAVLHAATVWFDLDCRIYERRSDGRFILSGALPSLGRPGSGQLLEPDRAAHLVAARRFPSAGDMDDLGLANRTAEVLVLPVGAGEPAWLILLAGTVDANAELTFAAIARVLTADLQGRELARISRWQHRLAELPFAARAIPQRGLTDLLRELMREIEADSARVTSVEAGERRVLATVQSPESPSFTEAVDQWPADLCHLQVTLSMGRDAALRLDLLAKRNFSQAAYSVAQTWLKALQPWIAELALGFSLRNLLGSEQGAVFESRMEEEVRRASRFGLGLGLLLIGRGPLPMPEGRSGYAAVIGVLRRQLRASDVLGLLRSGHLGVLLLHAGPDELSSVAARLAPSLVHRPGLPDGLHLGVAALLQELSTQQLVTSALAGSRAVSSY